MSDSRKWKDVFVNEDGPQLVLMNVNVESKKYHLTLSDGSKWFVNPFDLSTVITWTPGSIMKVNDTDKDPAFSSEVTNADEGVSILAMRIG